MQQAAANTIVIDSCSNTGFDGLLLWQKILDANANPGPDTIQTSCDYHFGAPYPGTSYVLPPITDSLTIVGGSYTVYSQDLRDRFGIVDVPAGVAVELQDVTMTTNVSNSDGAYVHNAGLFTLTDSHLLGYGTILNGPAVVNGLGGEMHINGSTVNGMNDATRAGALVNANYMYLNNSTLEDNDRNTLPNLDMPPTIRNSAYLQLDNSVLRQNPGAPGTVVWARGIDTDSDLVVRNTSFSGFTGLRGAAIENFGGIDVDQSSFVSNAAHSSSGAGGSGGAIFTEGTADISNSVFRLNTADFDGGAIWNASFTAVHYSTFAGNTAGRTGGDVYNFPGDTSNLSLATSIVASCAGTLLDGGANLVTVAGSTCPGTLGNAQLEFGTYPGVRGIVAALRAGSDAIDLAVGANCPSVDQRNLPRPAGGVCDVGAFENQVPTAPTSLTLQSGSNPTNTGAVTLTWTASTDADGDPISYRLYGQDANDAAETLLATLTPGMPIAVPLTLAEGTYHFRVEAYDGIHTSASSATMSGLVVDKTAPPAPTDSPDRAPDYTAGDGTDWYRDHVTVTFSSADPALADGSPGSGLAFLTAPQTLTTSGAHLLTAHAEDQASNIGQTTSVTYYVDADAPTVGFAICPATVKLKSATTLSWTASDAESGLATPSSGTFTVDTATIGERTLTATATDNVGHTTSVPCTVQVIYDFAGFYKPVANPPTTNRASAGTVINVSFSLHGDQGLGIFAAGYPVSAQITCGTNPQLTTGQATTTVSPGLMYAGSPSGRYFYAWKTSAAWAGTCRQFVLKLNDGTYHRANFSFR